MKCKYFKGLLKLNIKTFTALFVRVLSGFDNWTKCSFMEKGKNIRISPGYLNCSGCVQAMPSQGELSYLQSRHESCKSLIKRPQAFMFLNYVSENKC